MRKILCDVCGNETNEKDLSHIILYTNESSEELDGTKDFTGKHPNRHSEICVECKDMLLCFMKGDLHQSSEKWIRKYQSKSAEVLPKEDEDEEDDSWLDSL
jgi:hypothetical protein